MTQRTFYVPRAVGPLQVELPEFKTKGRKGALHIRPSSTLFLSDDEVEFLKENEKVLFSKLRETTPKKKEGAKPVASTPSTSPATSPVLELSGSGESDSGSKEYAPSSGRKKKGKEFE